MLPGIIKARGASRALRIWCAAASTGQEPLTIAMVIREHFPQLADWDVRITATDINETVLARARLGTFKQLEMNRGLPANLLVRYFEKTGLEWKAKPIIREMVTYSALNLLDRFGHLGTMDVIFIRNVLIYFDLPTKKAILGRVRDLLPKDGFLVLGGAETTLNVDDKLAPVKVGQSVFYQSKG